MDSSRLKENMGLKVGSLAVALLLWFHIATEKDTYERILDIPIHVVGLPVDLVVSMELPHSAQVRFQGRGKRLLTLPWRDVQVIVDASDIGSRGTRTRVLDVESVHYPEGPDLQVLGIVTPEQITIETDRLVRLRLPVVPRMQIQIDQGYTRVGSESAVPDTVTLTGPELRLRRLSYVETDTFRRRRLASDPIDQEVEIQVPPIYNLTVEPSVVRIVQDIQRLGVRTFSEVPVIFKGTDQPNRYLAQPPTASVTISGGIKVLETLTLDDISLILDMSRQRPDGLTPLIPRLELPPGISCVSLDPERFRVTEY